MVCYLSSAVCLGIVYWFVGTNKVVNFSVASASSLFRHRQLSIEVFPTGLFFQA